MDDSATTELIRLNALCGKNIGAYMNQVRRIPFLIPQLQQDLATIAQEGVEAEESLEKCLKGKRTLTSAQRKSQWYTRLQRQIIAGKEAQIRLVYHNLRFAAYFARHSMGWKQHSDDEFITELNFGKPRGGAPLHTLDMFAGNSLPLEDRIQVGNLSLIKSAGKYQPYCGERIDPVTGAKTTKPIAKFTTYAAHNLYDMLHRAFMVEKYRDGLSLSLARSMHQMQAARKKLRRLTGYEPSINELVDDTDLGYKAVEFRLEEEFGCPNTTLEELATTTWVHDLATNARLGLADLLWDDTILDPHDTLIELDLLDSIERVLGTLSEREAGVIALRFGLRDGECRTLDEIGYVYGVTRERIRQILGHTMTLLRHPSRSNQLRNHWCEQDPLEERDERREAKERRDRTITLLSHPHLYPDTIKPIAKHRAKAK